MRCPYQTCIHYQNPIRSSLDQADKQAEIDEAGFSGLAKAQARAVADAGAATSGESTALGQEMQALQGSENIHVVSFQNVFVYICNVHMGPTTCKSFIDRLGPWVSTFDVKPVIASLFYICAFTCTNCSTKTVYSHIYIYTCFLKTYQHDHMQFYMYIDSHWWLYN